MNLTGDEVLQQLLEGNERFRNGQSQHHRYTVEDLREISQAQKPIAAVIACSDSRIAPEVVFDQPLGNIFASRVPGNVASDSAKWMLDIAVHAFHVPLVMVMGHTGCLAVNQLLDGDLGGSGGMHRYVVLQAVNRAKSKGGEDLFRAAVEENACQTAEELLRHHADLQTHFLEGRTKVVAAIYEMETGSIKLLEPNLQL